jgi:hypothetical protein
MYLYYPYLIIFEYDLRFSILSIFIGNFHPSIIIIFKRIQGHVISWIFKESSTSIGSEITGMT